jgi:DUF1680 family protein
VVFLSDYTANHSEFSQYQEQMRKRMAFDYMKLAIYAADRKDPNYYSEMLKHSKKTYRYKITKPVQFILQHLPVALTYPIVRLVH